MCTTILCTLMLLAFTFKNNQIIWLWVNNKPVAVVLGVLSIYLLSQWVKYQRLYSKNKQKS
jgi:hypothetical protein